MKLLYCEKPQLLVWIEKLKKFKKYFSPKPPCKHLWQVTKRDVSLTVTEMTCKHCDEARVWPDDTRKMYDHLGAKMGSRRDGF